MQKAKRPPVRARLLRIRGDKADVWLLTNVLEQQRLTRKQAGKFYRWRWRNEGLFRTYKRTLAKVKLRSRTVRLVHREAEGSLLAVQLLLGQGAVALAQSVVTEATLPSARAIVLAIRDELRQTERPSRRRQRGLTYGERLQRAHCEIRSRSSPKATRVWPRRKPHEAPKAPQLKPLTEHHKTLLNQLLKAAQDGNCSLALGGTQNASGAYLTSFSGFT
jgi:hypothetical protein